MVKILIAGIGGVGGYFGGLLAKKYENSPEVEIDFLSRGEHLKEIQKNGLKIIKGNESIVVRPKLATDNVAEIGPIDYLIICTKNYDLEASIHQLKPCIASHTIILPLLNGVDASDRIAHLLPHNMVLKGCVYIVSHIKENGQVENSGNIQKLFFGLDNESNEGLLLLKELFLNAGIEATLSENISSVIWEKFIFVSPIAATTSYYNKSIGRVVEENETLLSELLDEVSQVAIAKGIKLSADIKEKSLKMIKSLPYENSSSMHRDFKKGDGKTEIESLLGYVIKSGKEENIKTARYIQVYNELNK